ncbi:hypothetical protein [Spiroplasma alleghenense]|uniref:Transmembrane protein n=1 Tax=Spiroplasma alleghenense TaxID=216931 RepID=A0A345Z3C4_9MOLU|nr:hypothetical protein [Spiroplasma alleghenense]AXK51103.1 hypothetical protein SALLE_v1c04290 [Spiroplasma alleghenense]
MKELKKKYRNFSDVLSPVGVMFTKKMLKNSDLKIASEGDFVNRVQICTAIFYSLITTSVIFLLLIYYKISLTLELQNSELLNERDIFLLNDQINLINIAMMVIGFNIVGLTTIIIFFTKISLGNSTKYFTYFFNFIFICQLLFFCNFIFVLDAFGLFSKTSSLGLWINFITKWWLWVVVISLCLISYKIYSKLFIFINAINREWTKINMLRKTGDKENSFVFKYWIHPNENSARRLMIVAGSLSMGLASVLHFISIFQQVDLDFMKYFSLFFGVSVLLVSFMAPYNKFSIYYFGVILLIYSGLMIYSLVVIQEKSYLSGHQVLFVYLFNIIIWFFALGSNVNIWIAILNKINVYAVVVKPFDSVEQFKESVEKIYEQAKKNDQDKKENI